MRGMCQENQAAKDAIDDDALSISVPSRLKANKYLFRSQEIFGMRPLITIFMPLRILMGYISYNYLLKLGDQPECVTCACPLILQVPTYHDSL